MFSVKYFNMEISQLDALNPQDFLDHALATTSPENEQNYDIAYFVIKLIKYVFVPSIVKLNEIFQFYKENVFQENIFLNTTNIHILNNSKKFSLVDQQKIFYIVSKTQQIAALMGLGSVNVSVSLDRKNFSFILDNPYTIRSIEFERNLFELTEKEIDFVIAHALAHLKNQESVQDFLFSLGVILVDLVASFRLFNDLTNREQSATGSHLLGVIAMRTLFQAVLGFTENTLRTQREEKADQIACQVLDSSEGMVKLLHRELKNNYFLKHGSDVESEESDYWNFRITPEGNDRDKMEHPALTKRLSWALSFKPKNYIPKR